MDKLIRMNTMIRHATGETWSVADWSQQTYGDVKTEVYRNSMYQVIKRTMPPVGDSPNIIWLSIKRIDREPSRDWRDFQDIKNQLVGRYCEGIEIYPAESRLVDTANQFHLWVFDDPKYRMPFGFHQGRLVTNDDPDIIGAKQRPLKSLRAVWDTFWSNRRLRAMTKKHKEDVEAYKNKELR